MGGEVKRSKVLLCYDYQNGIIDEKEDIIFVEEPDLFSIGTISLPETIQYVKTTYVEIMDTNLNISNSKLKSREHSVEKKIIGNRYEPKVALKDKVYPKPKDVL